MRIFLLLVLLWQLCSLGRCYISPVLVWNCKDLPHAGLTLMTLTEQEFADIVRPLLQSKMLIAFQEQQLSIEDMSLENELTGKSYFEHLQQLPFMNFYAKVRDPAVALSYAASAVQYTHVNAEGDLPTDVKCDIGTVTFVNFKAQNGTRMQQLQAHDAAMHSLMQNFACPTVFLYYGAQSLETRSKRYYSVKTNSMIFKNRKTHNVPAVAVKSGYGFAMHGKFLFIYRNVYIQKSGQPGILLNLKSMTLTMIDETLMNFTCLTDYNDNSLEFNVMLKNNDYRLNKVQFGGTEYPSVCLSAPTTLSYYCREIVMTPSKTDGAILVWHTLQFQAPFDSMKEFNMEEIWDCAGYFSSGIITCLLASAVLLTILFVSIYLFMSLQTFDRFDTYGDKSITINVRE